MAPNAGRRAALRWTLILIAVAGLVVDAYVHFHLASGYAAVRTSTLSEADLFRAEATVSALAAAALLLRPRRYTAAIAFVVAAGGTAAVLVYSYVNVGAFGPFPDMYDPIWYGEKTLSAVGEGIGAVAALALFTLLHLDARRTVPAAARPVGNHTVDVLG